MHLRRLFRQVLSKKQDAISGIPGMMGNGSGLVDVPGRPGYVYVRMDGVGGTVVAEVANYRVPKINGLPVTVGIDPAQPNVIQVLSSRAVPMNQQEYSYISGVPKHHTNHEYPAGFDIVWVQLQQFLPLRVLPAGGMVVRVYRGTIWTGTAWVAIRDDTYIDLSPYRPATEGKVKLVLLTIDNTGSIIITPGSEVNIADLTMADIPSPPAGSIFALAAVRVYHDQTTIYESQTTLDIIDLRFPSYVRANSGAIPGIDSTAIHDNVAGEIAAVTEKTTPVSNDLILIEDSVASNAKKRIKIGNLPAAAITRTATFTVAGTLSVVSGPIRIYNDSGTSRTISKVFLAVNTAPVGSAIIVDVHKNGTTIFTNQANRPQIAASANTGQTTTIDVPTWADGEYLQIDIDQVGSTTAGSNLTVQIDFT